MPSMFEQSMMLEALSGDSDKEFPHGMRAYREQAAQDPEKWRWCIEEAARRRPTPKQESGQ